MIHDIYVDDVLRERWDDTTRTYTAYDEQGVETSSRPYAAEENADADQRDIEAEEQAAAAVNHAAIKTITTDLKAEKDKLDVIIAKSNAAITGADTKDVARSAKRIADAAIELAKFTESVIG